MTFNAQQVEALQSPLEATRVSTRQTQGAEAMTHLLASDVVWLAVQIGTILNTVLLVYVAVMVTKGRKS